jgi:hypothetical protein
MLLKTLIGAAALLAAPAAFAQTTTAPTDPSATTTAPAPAPQPDPAPAPQPDTTTTTAPAPDPATTNQDPMTAEPDKADAKKGKKKPH